MVEGLIELLSTLSGLAVALGHALVVLGRALLPLLPGGLWCAWWLWCVNWRKLWPVLAHGGWLVVVLFMFTVALAWSGVSPAACDCLGFPLPSFWWHTGAVSALTVLALFCGWLQGQLGWTPAEVSFEPAPAAEPGHGHGGHH